MCILNELMGLTERCVHCLFLLPCMLTSGGYFVILYFSFYLQMVAYGTVSTDDFKIERLRDKRKMLNTVTQILKGKLLSLGTIL